MRTKKLVQTVGITVGLLAAETAMSEEVTLVRDGKPTAAIVLEAKPTRSAQMGAFELQHHVKLITGATLPIHTKTAPKGTETVIRIGGSNAGLKEETSIIKFTKGEILLTGGDTLDYGKVNYKKEGTFPPIDYHWKGSLFAVYDFLEYYCGVGFYGVHDIDTTYKKRTTLTVKTIDRKFTSPMDGFRDAFDDLRAKHLIKVTNRNHALWKLRWRFSITYGKTNHNTYSIYFAHWNKAKDPNLAKAFKKRRPEMFAKGYEQKGASVGYFLEKQYPGDLSLPPQLCYTNPATVEYYAREAITYSKGKNVIGGWRNLVGKVPTNVALLPRFPGKPYYYPYEGNDCDDFCLCKDCQIIVKKGNVTDQKLYSITQMIRKAAELEPGGKIGFNTLAYGDTLAYPEVTPIPENIGMQLCLTNYAWWHPVIYKKNMDTYKKWVNGLKGKGMLSLWLYVYGPVHDSGVHYGNFKIFPQFYPWQMAKQMKQFTKDGVKGVFLECKMTTNALETYVASKLMYDPSLDANKIIDQYFNDLFGAAGPTMKQIYKEIENAHWNNKNFVPKEWLTNPDVVRGPNNRLVSPWWATCLWSREINYRLGSKEMIAKLDKLLRKAQKQVKTPEEKKRLQLFMKQHWEPAVQGRRDFELYLKAKEIPPRHIAYDPIADGANGDPTRIDWSKAPKTEKWLSPDGKDIGSTASVRIISDSKYLYMKFHEQRKPDLSCGLWVENVEFYFADYKGQYPMYHFAHGPKANSTATGIRYAIVNDVSRADAYDFKAKTVSVPTDKDWTLYIAIPLNRLPIRHNRLALDFFRMRHLPNEKRWDVSCWQPTYAITGKNGMDSYGQLFIYPFTVEDSDFKMIWPNQATKRVKDEAAADGSTCWQTGKHGWYLSYTVPVTFPKDKVTVYARLRTECEKGDTLSFGVHDFKAKKGVFSTRIPLKDVQGKTYKEVKIGSGVLKNGMSVYTGSIVFNRKQLRNELDRIYVDSLRFEKAKE